MRLLVWAVSCTALAQCRLGGWDDYQLIWEDQFDTLDPAKWDHIITASGCGNKEFEVYTNDSRNSYVSNGILHIKPTLLAENTNPLTGKPFGEEFLKSGVLDLAACYGRCTHDNNNGCKRTGANNDIPPIMSARIKTAERFSFKYGRVRIRAQMPAGDWLWPAIWLLPERYVYGGWPNSGEIDLIEVRGNEDYKFADGKWAGYQRMQSTLHWGPNVRHNRYYLTKTSHTNTSTPYSRGFHMLEIDWSEEGFRFVVDGHELRHLPDTPNTPNPWTGFWDYGSPFPSGYNNPGWNTTMAPFDQPFHFVVNVAVGGTNNYFPEHAVNRGGHPNYTKPWSNHEKNVDPYEKYVDAFNSFYAGKDNWYWTWTKEGENSAMQIDFIEVYQKKSTKNMVSKHFKLNDIERTVG